ncbi:MAG: hypothetical protein PVI82_15475 [Desulfobacterales bacterium]|jgi:2,4-dienoyl-CoA reductase-like NADH-dependent reductase (Old Yellow Enzyme family)
MRVLFEAYEFSGIKMRNRFVRSATVNNLTHEENCFTPVAFLMDYYIVRLTRGTIK